MQGYCDVFVRIISKRTSTEAYIRCHQGAKFEHFDVSNVIYHKFSHGAVSYTLHEKNVNVMTLPKCYTYVSLLPQEFDVWSSVQLLWVNMPFHKKWLGVKRFFMHLQCVSKKRRWQNLTWYWGLKYKSSVIWGMDNFFWLYHQVAVNSNRKSVKADDGHSVFQWRELKNVCDMSG